MNEGIGQLTLVDAQRPFQPGDMLVGSFAVPQAEQLDVRSVEISVLWTTLGKGEEDLGVHFFERLTATGVEAVHLARRRDFRTILPSGPMSYDGIAVKIGWLARLRIFLPRGQQRVVDRPFRLGRTVAAKHVLPEEPELGSDV